MILTTVKAPQPGMATSDGARSSTSSVISAVSWLIVEAPYVKAR
jgi:hypothetical protein